MKRAMLIAVFVILATGSGRASLVGSLNPVTVATNLTLAPEGHGTMGILNGAGSIISGSVMSNPNGWGVITVTLAIHWRYNAPLFVERSPRRADHRRPLSTPVDGLDCWSPARSGEPTRDLAPMPVDRKYCTPIPSQSSPGMIGSTDNGARRMLRWGTLLLQ